MLQSLSQSLNGPMSDQNPRGRSAVREVLYPRTVVTLGAVDMLIGEVQRLLYGTCLPSRHISRETP